MRRLFRFFIYDDNQSTVDTNGSFSSYICSLVSDSLSHYIMAFSLIKCTHGNGKIRKTLVNAIKIYNLE